jgi:hypothetical protein
MTNSSCIDEWNKHKTDMTNTVKELAKLTNQKFDYDFCKSSFSSPTAKCSDSDISKICHEMTGGGSSSMWIWILIIVLVILAVGVGFYVVEKKKKRGGGRYAAVPAMPNSINGW